MLFKKVPGQVDAVYTAKCYRVSVSFTSVCCQNFNRFAASGSGRCSTIFVCAIIVSYLVNMRCQLDSIQMSRGIRPVCAGRLVSRIRHSSICLSTFVVVGHFSLAVFRIMDFHQCVYVCVHRVIPSGMSFLGELHDRCGLLVFSFHGSWVFGGLYGLPSLRLAVEYKSSSFGMP